MSVSKALENSARNFSDKYACQFDFATFESRVEEFTFLRPNGGWIDVYKMMFEKVYKNSLEKVAMGMMDNLDGEAMLDDFEYTLIRPYVNERKDEIKHKPYVGMDRIARLVFLDQLIMGAPTNLVELYIEKYKNGELTVGQIRRRVKYVVNSPDVEREDYIEIAAYVQALEKVNQARSLAWRVCHSIQNKNENKLPELIKKAFVARVNGGEAFLNEVCEAAYERFDGYKNVNANLAESIVHAREEMKRNQRMNEARRESLHA